MSGQPQATQGPRRVLVKVKHYDGSESVLRRHDDPELAQAQADAYNEAFQTDTCYVEDYDPEKAQYPSMGDMAEWHVDNARLARLQATVDAVRVLPHEDQCCTKGCPGYGLASCGVLNPGETCDGFRCSCFISRPLRAIANALGEAS